VAGFLELSSLAVKMPGQRLTSHISVASSLWHVRVRTAVTRKSCWRSSAAVGTAWSLLGLHRNGQPALYPFQKHLLCREYIHSFSTGRHFWNGQNTGQYYNYSCILGIPMWS